MVDATVAILVSIVGLIGTIITVIATSKTTRDQLTNQLQINQAVTNTEISHLKQDITEMKADIKEHNNYAKHMPVIEEQVSNINRRLDAAGIK